MTGVVNATDQPTCASAPDPKTSAPEIPENAESFLETVREMCHELVQSRELLWQMTLRNIRIRYKQAVMGYAWAVLMPMIIVAAGVIVKYAMAQGSGNQMAVAGVTGMAVKALPWAFFVGALGFAVNSLTANRNLVTKIYFPREVFPVSAVLTQAVDTAIGATSLLAVLFLFMGLQISVAFLWTIPLTVVLILLTTMASLLASAANLFFRDVKYLVQIILTFGIFFTPVFYDPADFGKTGSRLMMLNPMTPILEGFRLSIVEQHDLSKRLFAKVKKKQGLAEPSEQTDQPEKEVTPATNGSLDTSTPIASNAKSETPIHAGDEIIEATPADAQLGMPKAAIEPGQTAFAATDQRILVWTPYYLLYSALWAIPGCLVAWWAFHKLEFVYAEYV